MGESFLWSIKLDNNTKTVTWNPDKASGDHDGMSPIHSLVLKQAILSSDAERGELNVVQVEGKGVSGPIKTPIACLEAGSVWQCPLDMEYTDLPITFTLIKGSGPVHVNGNNLITPPGDEGEGVEEEEDEDDMDDEEMMEAEMAAKLMEERSKKNGKPALKEKKEAAKKK